MRYYPIAGLCRTIALLTGAIIAGPTFANDDSWSATRASSRPADPATRPAPLETILETGTPVTVSIPFRPLVDGLRQLSAASGNPTYVAWNRSMALDLLTRDKKETDSLTPEQREVLGWPCAPGKRSARQIGELLPLNLWRTGMSSGVYLANIRNLGTRPVWGRSDREPYWKLLHRMCVVAGLKFQPGRGAARQRYLEVSGQPGKGRGRTATTGPLFARLSSASLRVWIEPQIGQCGMLLRRLAAGPRLAANLLPELAMDGAFVFALTETHGHLASIEAEAEIELYVPVERATATIKPGDALNEKPLPLVSTPILVRFAPAQSRRDQPRWTFRSGGDRPGDAFGALIAMDEASVRPAGPETRPADAQTRPAPATGLADEPETSLAWRTAPGKELIRQYTLKPTTAGKLTAISIEVPTKLLRKTYTLRFKPER